ncbi:MAG: PDZ domain-containing protein, partial [Calditrichia bacterium]|nr:PDZ domain-containing protein [Calditrichia bacterium]
MQNKTITSLIIISLTVMFVFNMNADISKHQKLVTHVLLSTIKSQHYNPADINDDFSKKVFKQYIERLDYGKRFFLQSDIEQLKKFEFEIDNELRQITDEFYSAANEIFYQRVNEVNEFYKEILEKPFNYDLSDSLQTDYEKLDYCNSKEELYNRWSKILQYQTAFRYLEIVDSKLKVKENDVEKEDEKISYLTNEKLYEESEVKARGKIAKRTKRVFDRIIKKTEEEKYAEYLNAVTNVFDPHTSYFPPKDKEDFDIRMTGKFEGIGASLSQEDGYTKVNSIIPGSASYRQGELKQEDIILKVAQGEEEPVDVVDMPLREVVKLIRGKKGTEVCLTVRKPDMNIVVIPIIRDEVVLEETYAKAVTIKNNGKKIGYIQLLNFYRDFSDNKARNATSDIRAAIEHMDNVDGLVLDLRNNGGGALPDAIDIAGLFIETGPIVQVREKNGRKKVYRDNDPAVYHTGPLIILINQFSASASEILAAALQDYGRAVIVGSPHTYGKGTVQVMLDLDRA